MATETPAPFEPIASHVERLATELSAFLHDSGPPWTGTPAGDDLSQDAEYAGAWGSHPIQDVLLLPFSLLLHTGDHLFGIAGVLRAPETVMTHQTLSRAGLASCALAHYLIEPEVDVRERLRRGMNAYLLSFTEQINMANDDQLDALVPPVERIQAIVTSAREHGFGVSKAPGGRLTRIQRGREAPYLGTAPPKEMELVARLVDGDAGDDVGRLVYRMGSAFTHGQPHLMNMLNLARMRSDVEGMALARVRISVAEAVRDTAALVFGVHRTMLSACERYGWSAQRWQSAAQPVLQFWASGLDALSR